MKSDVLRISVSSTVYDVMQLEEAAKEVADEITAPRPEGETVVQDIQVLLKSDANPISVRDLKVWKENLHFEVED